MIGSECPRHRHFQPLVQCVFFTIKLQNTMYSVPRTKLEESLIATDQGHTCIL